MATVRPIETGEGSDGPDGSVEVGAGVSFVEHEVATVTRRAGDWCETLRPANSLEAFFVAQIATESVRVERYQFEERTTLALALERASDPAAWAEDRALEAEELGARLSRDPERTAVRLRQSLQGCEWLRKRWEGLAAVLRAGHDWDDPQRTLALDLLGVPVALRSGPTPLDQPHAELAAAQVRALAGLRTDRLLDRDENERAAAESGVLPDGCPSTRLLKGIRRSEAACQRRLARSLNLLLSGRLVRLPRADAEVPTDTPAVPAPAQPDSRSAPAPAPAPAPSEADLAPDPDVLPHASPTWPVPSESPARSPRGNRRWRRARRRAGMTVG